MRAAAAEDGKVTVADSPRRLVPASCTRIMQEPVQERAGPTAFRAVAAERGQSLPIAACMRDSRPAQPDASTPTSLPIATKLKPISK